MGQVGQADTSGGVGWAMLTGLVCQVGRADGFGGVRWAELKGFGVSGGPC